MRRFPEMPARQHCGSLLERQNPARAGFWSVRLVFATLLVSLRGTRPGLVRKAGLEPACLLGATPSRWCVCQFRHFRSEFQRTVLTPKGNNRNAHSQPEGRENLSQETGLDLSGADGT